jgi:hypothetical protein
MQHGTNGTAARNSRYSVAEVAERLGVTTRAVRKRIAAGQLHAERTPHGWTIALEAEPPAELTAPAAELAAPTELEEPTEPAAPREPIAPLAEPASAPAEPLAELAALRAQVAWLQAEVERRDAAEGELRRLLALALQTRALPAPPVPPVEPTNLAGANLPPWWSWRRWAGWRR